MTEVESYDEFLLLTKSKLPNEVHLKGWIFQAVDFSLEKAERFSQYDVSGAWFFGCTLPPDITEMQLIERGARVHNNPPFLPFKPFRGFMYTQKELAESDHAIYDYYLKSKDIHSKMWESAHDFCIYDALHDYIYGKTVVAILGGHSLKRSSVMYANVVWLSYKLARKGFLVATGGGPGAMEAGNLGAYLAQRTEEEVAEAIKLIAQAPTNEVEYLDFSAPLRVLERFGPTTHMPSLGIPTYKYGHEPSNKFATFHAKFFSNAIREDVLIQRANGGTIYCPGSAGTRQEIFQDACKNHYAAADLCCPMVFFDKIFWKTSGVFDLVYNTSVGQPYHNLLSCEDSIDTIVDFLLKYQTERNLPLIADLEELTKPFWIRSTTISKDLPSI